MPFTFNADVGGAAATSLVSVDAADTVLGGRLNATAWTDAGETRQQQALTTATALLERARWLGRRATTTQALAWPRTGVTAADGAAVDDATIPADVQAATCELALRLLAGTVAPEPSALAAFKRLEAGPLTIEPATDATATAPAPVDGLPADIAGGLAHYLVALAFPAGTVPLTRLVRAS